MHAPWTPVAMAPNSEHVTHEHVTEVDSFFWRIKLLFMTELAHRTATVGEQPVSPSSSRPPTELGFWQSSAITPTVRDPAPSSCRWREASPAPSLPSADLCFWQPENPRPSHCGQHREESTESRHSTPTLSTTLTTPRSLASILSYSSQQSLSSCHDTQTHCAPPFGASVGDILTNELLVQDLQKRPLGCKLGTSLHPLTARSSILASSLSPSCFDELRKSEQHCACPAAMRAIQHTGTCSGSLAGAKQHASGHKTVTQKWPLPTAVGCTWSPLPSPRFLASQELPRLKEMRFTCTPPTTYVHTLPSNIHLPEDGVPFGA